MQLVKTNVRVLSAVVGLLIVLGLAVWVNLALPGEEFIRIYIGSHGYFAIFLLSVISGFNVFFPVPVVAFFPYLVELGYIPSFLVFLIAAGMTTGDALGFVLGRAGRVLTDDAGSVSPRWQATVGKLERIKTQRPWSPFFLLLGYAAFVPAPNELIVIPLAYLKTPAWQMLLAVLLGNMVFTLLGALGALWVF